MRRPSANLLLNRSQHYRTDAFREGLKKVGYTVISDRTHMPRDKDIVISWNRSTYLERVVSRYKTAIITENGYLGKTKAMALTHHAGAGEWFIGDESRFPELDIELKPWRKDGEHILVLPQRSIGEPGVAMPRNWTTQVINRLKKLTDRPIIVRQHPGTDKSRPVELDLENAWASVVWASGAGVKSIIAGVPVFYDFGKWIGSSAASCVWDIENPYLGDRLNMLHRLSWAQWTIDEIKKGIPFDYLLNRGPNNGNY